MERECRERKAEEKDNRDLWDARIEASCRELEFNAWVVREAFGRLGIQLDRKVVAELAINEPRSFR